MFDGNGHIISNLTINSPEINEIGLFSKVKSGYIKNITLENVQIAGKYYVGGLVGQSSFSTITNCHIANISNVSGVYEVGGLIGQGSNNTFVSLCSSAADIMVDTINNTGGIGGLVGNLVGDIEKSYSIGDIIVSRGSSSGSSGVGGLVGTLKGTVKQSYSIGNVQNASMNIGGLAGYVLPSSIIENCYAIGNVTSGSQYQTAGLVGYNYGLIKNAYFIGRVSTGYGIANRQSEVDVKSSYFSIYADFNNKVVNTPENLARTTTQMQQQSTFVGWDFENIWKVDEGNSYPTLIADENNPAGEMFSAEELFLLAESFLQITNLSTMKILKEKYPLYNEINGMFAYAIPFTENGFTSGYSIIGARKDGIAHLIISHDVNELKFIIEETSYGNNVYYMVPFIFYVKESNLMTLQNTETLSDYYQLEYSDERMMENEKLLNNLKRYSPRIAPTIYQLKSESTKDYVRIENGSNGYYYGGNQAWWNANDYVSMTGNSGKYMENKGCGVVAFSNILAYNLSQNYDDFSDLLKYSDKKKEITNFDKTILYNSENKSFTLENYRLFMDFYATIAGQPGPIGMNDYDMLRSFTIVNLNTPFNSKRSVPLNNEPDTVDDFIKDSLSKNKPVLLLNYMDFVAANRYHNAFIDNHWVTIDLFGN